MYEDLKSIRKTMDDAKKVVKDLGEQNLKSAFKELFTKYPDILEIVWEQYTPYFNDGNACVFGVSDPSVKLASKIHDATIDTKVGPDDRYDDERYVEAYHIEDMSMRADVMDIFKLAGDDVMETTFGDHSSVSATRDGFTVEEYDHD